MRGILVSACPDRRYPKIENMQEKGGERVAMRAGRVWICSQSSYSGGRGGNDHDTVCERSDVFVPLRSERASNALTTSHKSVWLFHTHTVP
jgi:hypothetical protein